MKIEIIFSFDGVIPSQVIQTLAFSVPPSEAEFLLNALGILALLKKPLNLLRKISSCHIIENDEPTPAWLVENNGKYFFGGERRVNA